MACNILNPLAATSLYTMVLICEVCGKYILHWPECWAISNKTQPPFSEIKATTECCNILTKEGYKSLTVLQPKSHRLMISPEWSIFTTFIYMDSPALQFRYRAHDYDARHIHACCG
jgi:hypothetical protein